MSLLVTGFGPFGEFAVNPSALLAAECFANHRIVRVAFAAVDELLDELSPQAPGILIGLGAHGKAETLRFELFARNAIGETADVDGVRRGGSIWPGGPARLGSTALSADDSIGVETAGFAFSADAGNYLCNYLLFQALRRLPDWRVGFVHVPTFSRMAQAAQSAQLDALLTKLVGEEPE